MKYLALLILFSSILFSKDLLWKVEEGDATIYITGSIHYGKDDFYPLPNAFDSTFALSDNLVLEVDLDTLEAKAMTMMQAMMLSGGKTLKSMLSDSSYAMLVRECKAAGIPLLQLQMFKPWAAAMTVTQMKLQKTGLNPMQGIDRYFFNKAKENSMDVMQLESVESQIEVFNSFDELSDEFVMKTLQSTENEMEMLDEMIAAWKKADLEALDEIINRDADSEEFQQINAKLLDDRNFKMMKKLENYMKTDETYFVVVGAGHLSGENGLINLLKEKYKIVQL